MCLWASAGSEPMCLPGAYALVHLAALLGARTPAATSAVPTMRPGADSQGSWLWGNVYLRDHNGWVRKETVPGATFYAEALWFWPGERKQPAPGEPDTSPQAHTHPFPEMIGFFGTNPDDIHDLGGEVELFIGGEKHVMTRSFVAYIPANLEHCPLHINRIGDRPIFHFTAGPGAMYDSGDQ